MKRGSEWVLGVCLAATTACGAKSLDAGSNDPDYSGYDDDGVPWKYPQPSHSWRCVEGDPDCHGTPCVGAPPDALAGRWTGAAEPDRPIEMVVEFLGRGRSEDSKGLCGTVTFGGGAPPPLPEDPEAWPYGQPTVLAEANWITPGFTYEFWTESAPEFSDSGDEVQLTLPLFTHQIYKAWCELQLAYFVYAGLQSVRSCLPRHVGVRSGLEGCSYQAPTPDGVEEVPVSCARAYLCDKVCECSEEGCTVHHDLASSAPDVFCTFVASAGAATGEIATEWGTGEFNLRKEVPSP